MKPATQTALESAAASTLLAFGARAQMIKTCEELGELTTQLCKMLNGAPTTNANVVDEIADVLVMANQMRSLFGADAVDDRIVFKLNRTMEFIRKRKEESENGATDRTQ